MKKGIYIGIFLLYGLLTFGQDIKVSAKLDTNAALIGDWIKLKIELERGKEDKVYWPQFEGNIRTADTTELEILSATKRDTVEIDPQRVKETQQFTLTVFDSGYYVIPPFQFKHLQAQDTSVVETEPLLLSVYTVPVDTTQPIKPIKAPFSIPFNFRRLIPYILIGLALILLIAGLLIYFLFFRKKKEPVIKRVVRKQPPHETALEKLKELEEKKLWQQGATKQYYSELSDIIREYIEGRFRFSALESTTDEIMAKFFSVSIPQGQKDKLQDLLQSADLVKFAKFSPLPDENKRYLDIGYEFVRTTKTEEQAENIMEGSQV